MVKVPIRKGFPSVLSIDKADRCEKFKGFDDEMKAVRYSKKHGGQMYTQVDTEGRDGTAYMRGHHIVNRTGYYVVVDKCKLRR